MSGQASVYYVHILDPSTGRFRVLCLFDGIAEGEVTDLVKVSFEDLGDIIGFTDDKGVYYPFSFLWKSPKSFAGSKLVAISQAQFSPPSLTLSGPVDLFPADSEASILTDDKLQNIFKLLDLNNDNVVHKEEFIQVSTLAFNHLMETDPGLSFAFQCLSPKELAVATATSCYQSQPEGVYFLEYEELHAWLISTGFDPLRDLLLFAMNVSVGKNLVVSSPTASYEARLRRTKSRTHLDLADCFDNGKIATFVELCRRKLSLSTSNILDILEIVNSFPRSIRNVISKDKVLSLLLKNVADEEVSQEDVSYILVSLLDVLNLTNKNSCSTGHFISLLAILAHQHNRDIFESVFQFYEDGSGFGNEIMLYMHLYITLHLIFYFNSSYGAVTGAKAENIAHAIYVKLLLSADINRKSRGKLSLAEFIEVFVHSLKMCLELLDIKEGYFSDLLACMVGYQMFSPLASVQAEDSTSPALEDDQIASVFVGYNGAAISVTEAREALGLFEYTSYDVVKYLTQLADEQKLISHLTFQRGIMKLIGDYYVQQTVLQRSVADFILDRLVATHDHDQTGDFRAMDVCIALLLFTEDDDYDRGLVMLALVKNKVLKFSVVKHVAEVLIRTCYSLSPTDDPADFIPKAQSDAAAYCMEQFMSENSAGSSDPNAVVFTNAQFVSLVNTLLVYLEEVSDMRKANSDLGLRGEEEGYSPEMPMGTNESMDVKSFSDSDDEEENPYLDDQEFPPSATVLELRAASCILGLEAYKPDDLIDKLGGVCHAGKLNAKAWAKWFSQTIHTAQLSEADVDISMHLNNQIFNAFASKDKESVGFSDICPGLALLCSQAPLEDRLMVAFTVVDEDSDGYISFDELVKMIKSVLTVVTMCSRLAMSKVVSLQVNVEELSLAAAKEGYHSAEMKETEEMSLETFCDLAEDFLKLSCVL